MLHAKNKLLSIALNNALNYCLPHVKTLHFQNLNFKIQGIDDFYYFKEHKVSILWFSSLILKHFSLACWLYAMANFNQILQQASTNSAKFANLVF